MVAIVTLGVIFFIAGSIVLARVWPWGADYYYHFYPLAEQWLNGQFYIYDGPGERLFYPPWSLFVIIPLGFLPVDISHGFQLASSLILIAVSLRLFQDTKTLSLIAIFMSFINLHSFDLFIRGQIDAILLFGVVLGFWAIRHRKPFLLSLGLCLAVMKPPLNVALILLLFLISIRNWTRRELFIVSLAPTIMVLISSLMVGLDWPITYIQNLGSPNEYLSISFWDGAEKLGFPLWPLVIVAILAVLNFLRLAWREGATYEILSIALATNFVFTLYANGDHYVLLVPALLFVFQNHNLLGFISYAASWTPLVRILWGYEASSIDILYPILLLIFSYILFRSGKNFPENISQSKKNTETMLKVSTDQ